MAISSTKPFSSASLPVRGAWIEITEKVDGAVALVSLPVRGAWIEITDECQLDLKTWSLPVRGAWIEICAPGSTPRPARVAPRAGSVD